MHAKIIVRKREEKRVVSGHQWVFSNEISSISGAPKTGEIVDVVRHDGAFIGRGFYNAHSLIAVRILTRTEEEIDASFFKKRVEAALGLRAGAGAIRPAYRAVHGESDFLPGLIVDVYGTSVVMQTLSSGMDQRLEEIAPAIEALLRPEVIILRNDSPLRSLEGLDRETRVLRGDPHPVEVEEHGLFYTVDPEQGQKTGLFLDQSDNRLAVRRYFQGRHVLDCFCNAGGFGFNALKGGGNSVSFLDSSEDSIRSVQAHAERNGFAPCHTRCGDAFDVLEEDVGKGGRYGGIILDPPAFTRNRKTVATALKGYRRLNTLAMQLLDPGGILVTASCSHHIDRESFVDMIRQSALRAGRVLRILEIRGASVDHPVLAEMPETEYLKLAVCSVV